MIMQKFLHDEGFEFRDKEATLPYNDIERHPETRPASTRPATEGRWRDDLTETAGRMTGPAGVSTNEVHAMNKDKLEILRTKEAALKAAIAAEQVRQQKAKAKLQAREFATVGEAVCTYASRSPDFKAMVSEALPDLRRLREVDKVCFPRVTQAVCS